MLLREPSLNVLETTKALRLGKTVFQGLHHIRRNRLLAGVGAGLSNFLKPLKASLFVEFKPVGNGVAMDTQMAGRSALAFGLSSLHKKQHVIAALNLGVSLLANQTFELFDRLRDLREIVHGRRRCEEESYGPFQPDKTAQ